MEPNFNTLDHDQEEPIELPPGFRFHPTDDELIIHYLYRKVCDDSFVSRAIGDVALNRFEPWDLPLRAKTGEKEWYFFCVRDRKYPTGLRTNRATEMGYWKATGKDKEIYKAKTLVGTKKTLVFYKGRAPRGEKTNWVMHEFRLDGELAMEDVSKSAKGEWVISKVFEKNSEGKNTQISGPLLNMNYDEYENEVNFDSSNLPPLMDISSSKTETIFDAIQEQNPKNEDFNQGFNKSIEFMSSINNIPSWFPHTKAVQNNEYYHDPSILRFLTDNNNRLNNPQNQKIELKNDQDYTMDVAGPMDINCLWSY